MSSAKPLASLSPSLLARKGGARPAMRPQLAISLEDQHRVIFGTGEAIPALAQDDLGWNDLGDDRYAAPVAVDTMAEASKPVVVQQIEALAEAVAPAPRGRTKGGVPVRSALKEGRKAAFTLRLDNYRHLRLRLACTLEDRSAQAVVIEALDRYLADLPGLEDLARRAITRN